MRQRPRKGICSCLRVVVRHTKGYLGNVDWWGSGFFSIPLFKWLDHLSGTVCFFSSSKCHGSSEYLTLDGSFTLLLKL